MLSELMAVRAQKVQAHDQVVQFEDLLTRDHLEGLLVDFKEHNMVLTEAQFTKAVERLLSLRKGSRSLALLFRKMDASHTGESATYKDQLLHLAVALYYLFVLCETLRRLILVKWPGVVDWDEFCAYLVHDLQEKEALRAYSDEPLLVCPKLYDSPHR